MTSSKILLSLENVDIRRFFSITVNYQILEETIFFSPMGTVSNAMNESVIVSKTFRKENCCPSEHISTELALSLLISN